MRNARYMLQGACAGYLLGRVSAAFATKEKDLRLSRVMDRRFRVLVENAKDHAIFTMDLHARIKSWNVGAERLLGFSEREAIGLSAYVIFTPEDVAAGAPEREMLGALREGKAEDNRWHQRKDGTRFFTDGALIRLDNEDGTPEGFAKIIRDITELVQTKDRLKLSLIESNHRIKNSLNFFSGYLNLFLRRDEPPSKEELQKMLSNINVYAKLHDVLTLQASQELEGTAEKLPVKPLIDKLLHSMGSSVPSIKINWTVDDALVMTASKCSSVALIVNELVTNSLKYGKGEIHVSLQSKDGQGLLEVCDNGQGFSEDINKPTKGSGLSLVRRLTETDLKGRFRATNLPAGGACVKVEFDAGQHIPNPAETISFSPVSNSSYL